MRICYIADGRSIHFHRWLKFFAEAGHEMSFISYQPVEDAHVEKIERSGAAYLGAVGQFHLKRFWHTARDLRWLRRTLRRNSVDVVHCHFLGVNTWYAALSGFRPLAITVMGGGDVCGPGWRPQGRRERLLTPLALRRADLVTSWSPLMAEVVRPFCREETPVEVVIGGVMLEVFHPGPRPAYLRERWGIPETARVVFSPRLMRPLSNIHQIAEAAARVCAEDPDAYFLFAYPTYTSDAEYEARVREIIAAGAAAGRARFIGAIPHQEMADHYRLADVTVSIPGTDGTPMSALESMACGTPVVVGDIPDYDPFYFENGRTVLSVNVGDSNALAGALLRLLRDEELARGLAAEARGRVETRGSYEAQMSRMNQLYLGLAR